MRRFHLLFLLLVACISCEAQLGRVRPLNKAKVDAMEAAAEAESQQAAMEEQVTVAGNIMPVLSKLMITRDKAKAIFQALSDTIDLKEFFLLGFVGWAAVPLLGLLHRFRIELFRSPEGETDEEEPQEDDETLEKFPSFQDTMLYQAVYHVSQATRIGALVYVVDCLAVTLNAMGFTYQHQPGFSKKAARISYLVWFARRISAWKRYLLTRAFRHKPNAAGRTRLYDRLVNVALTVVTGGLLLDMFDIDFGLAIKSLLTFGGVGTLVISLASKDLASELVSGLALSTSDRFLEGDEIELGDGTAGFITRMGLAYTDLRGYDEIIARIPNSQLSQQRARNLSRIDKSQVKQTLWFGYEDISKMKAITEAIKQEIQASCPQLIADGSRPFRAHWREFAEDHLEVVVDCHFTIKPATQAYWDNREVMLEAIARAVEKVGVEFALPIQKIVSMQARDRHDH